MSYTQKGVSEITQGNFRDAFSTLEKGFFEEGETHAGCYLSQMFYDERISKRTDENLLSAMLLWHITSKKVPSSSHKLGVALLSMPGKAKNSGLEYIKSAAVSGYSASYSILGTIAYKKEDYDAAIRYFSQYDNINSDKSALLMYANSCCKVTPPIIERAELLYSLCANTFNDPSAYRLLAEIYLDYNFYDEKKSFEYMTKAADLGDVKAAQSVGIGYYTGIGGAPYQNYEKAYTYLSIAYKNNSGDAAAALGDFYAYGYYVDVNKTKARELYNDALRLGCQTVYNQIGFLYYTEKNYEKAYYYLKKRYDVGDTVMLRTFFDCAYKLFGNQTEPDIELVRIAFSCLRANIPLTDEHHIVLGFAYYNGIYVDQDIASAINHLRHCHSNPTACSIIGTMAAYGEHPDITPAQAEPYLLTAVKAGNSNAMLTLGKLYKKWNLATKAINMLTKAYSSGEKEAAREISDMYLNGDVTGRKDRKKAAEWLKKSET